MQPSKNSMVYVLCICGCVCILCVCVLMGRVLESHGFTAVHVEMFSYGNRSSVLNQEYIVAIHKAISFNPW